MTRDLREDYGLDESDIDRDEESYLDEVDRQIDRAKEEGNVHG